MHDLSGGLATRNRPNSRRNEFLDDVAARKYSAGKVKSTLAVSDPYCSMIEFSSVHSSQGRDRTGQGVGWPLIARNFRHVDLQVKPVRIPVVDEVGLAAGSDLNSRNPFSGVLASSVEGTACMLSFVELPSSTSITSGTVTNSKNLAKASTLRLRPKVFMIQINFDTSRKDVGES
jgi:hypothetical protein